MTTVDSTQTPESREKLVRSAGVMSAAVFLSRITGLVRESLMARLFGAGLANDAYQLGFRLPNLTRDLFAEGALSSAFVPIFTEVMTKEGKEAASRLANLVATAVILFVGFLCVVGIFFAPGLVTLFTGGGFEKVPGKFELAVELTRIMFPFLLLVALAAQAMGVLNSNGSFSVPAMASTFFNIGNMVFGLIVGYVLGPRIGVTPIEGMAWGVVAGGALQLFWQVPELRRLGFRYRPRFDWKDPYLRRIIRLMGPAILGNAAVQINVAVNTNLAATLPNSNGPVSWLGYAFRFMQLPLGLFGVSMATAALPSISRSAALGDMDQFRKTLSQSLTMVFLLTIPSSLGLIVLGRSVIGAIYQHGRFTPSDTEQTALALSFYAIGLTGYAALKVLTPAFYALGTARFPMYVGLASVLVNYATARTMIGGFGMGHASLALSTSAVALFGFLVQFFTLRERAGGLYGRELAGRTLRVLAASAVMTLVAYATTTFMTNRFGISQYARIADVAVSVPIAVAVYYSMCRLLKLTEIDLALRAFLGPVRRIAGRFS